MGFMRSPATTSYALQSVRRCFRSSPLQGLRFEVVPSWFKETLDKRLFKAPQEYAVETARQKALEVARRMPFKHLKTPDIVIGADTIVTVDGLILEKPVDKQDAYRMLSRLSGKEHSVCTGVAIVLCHQRDNEEIDYQTIDFYEETKVKFHDYGSLFCGGSDVTPGYAML
ncbi:hypothetical protein CRUP_020967, partial [Coryphaenoides rupestris]